jgi:hypothetical protein
MKAKFIPYISVITLVILVLAAQAFAGSMKGTSAYPMVRSDVPEAYGYRGEAPCLVLCSAEYQPKVHSFYREGEAIFPFDRSIKMEMKSAPYSTRPDAPELDYRGEVPSFVF